MSPMALIVKYGGGGELTEGKEIKLWVGGQGLHMYFKIFSIIKVHRYSRQKLKWWNIGIF